MRAPARRPPAAEALLPELLRGGESRQAAREFLGRHQPDDVTLLGLLRLPVPVRFLEHLATTPPWSERPRLLAGVVLNPRAPRSLALRLLPSLYWRDLAEVAASHRLVVAVRSRAESLLKDLVPDLRLGERITLGHLATPRLLALLLSDLDTRVVTSCLENPRLTESEVLRLLRGAAVSRVLVEALAASPRWMDKYAVRLALVLQVRTPLSLSLAQLSGLRGRDLARVAETRDLPPLVQAAARRLADELGRD